MPVITMSDDLPHKVTVIHFQRKPRPGFNFSIESIFEDIRSGLQDQVKFYIAISGFFNNGFFSKLWNIIEACFRQKKNAINHITGEVNFLNLLMRKKNVLLTIHDCRYVERKKGFQKRIVQWLYLKAPVEKAAFITTVSEKTKQEVINYTGCKAEKIQVIPVQVNALFKPFPKSFNKECPVLLQIGAAENKNIGRLIEAVKDIPCQLVIIGEPNNDERQLLQRYKIDHIIKSGLSSEELYREYINCDIVTFVSTHEGFGMPVPEANSVERVVLTSNISSMPEVAGNAAHLVNPYDVQEIKTGIVKLIQDDMYREQLIFNGRKNKERFSGEIIAETWYLLYQKIAATT
jgi:glycosyltransferase involved in cell wall biosynthesis